GLQQAAALAVGSRNGWNGWCAGVHDGQMLLLLLLVGHGLSPWRENALVADAALSWLMRFNCRRLAADWRPTPFRKDAGAGPVLPGHGPIEAGRRGAAPPAPAG